MSLICFLSFKMKGVTLKLISFTCFSELKIYELYASEIPEHQHEYGEQYEFRRDECGLVPAGQESVLMAQVHQQTKGDQQVEFGHFVKVIEVEDTAEHMADVTDRVRHVICAEEYPCEAYQEECDQDLSGFPQGWVPFSASEIIAEIAAVFSGDEGRDEQQRMYAAPGDEGPIGAMPKPAY